MGKTVRFPDDHAAFIERCHKAGQVRPMALLLQYGPDDYNCLHQDLYGEHVFPIQLAILLSDPETNFEGGEFVMTEQRPRLQTRPIVVPLKKRRRGVLSVLWQHVSTYRLRKSLWGRDLCGRFRSSAIGFQPT